MSVEVDLEAAKVTDQQTLTVAVTNTQGTECVKFHYIRRHMINIGCIRNSQTVNDQVSQMAAWTNPDGDQCAAVVNHLHILGPHIYNVDFLQTQVTDCTFTATGSIDVYLSGYIWLSFKTWVGLLHIYYPSHISLPAVPRSHLCSVSHCTRCALRRQRGSAQRPESLLRC